MSSQYLEINHADQNMSFYSVLVIIIALPSLAHTANYSWKHIIVRSNASIIACNSAVWVGLAAAAARAQSETGCWIAIAGVCINYGLTLISLGSVANGDGSILHEKRDSRGYFNKLRPSNTTLRVILILLLADLITIATSFLFV